MNKKVLVTGATGFIGKHLLRKLLLDKYTVSCFDIQFNELFFKEFENNVQIFQGNLSNEKSIRSCIIKSNPHYVFHLAGVKNRSNSKTSFSVNHEINYNGTYNLLNSLSGLNNLSHVITLGTIEEYGNANTPFTEDTNELPDSHYGLSKLAATKLSLAFYNVYQLPITILRPSIAFGPGQGLEMFIPAIIRSMQNNEVFKMTGGEQSRDFIYISDLIDVMMKTASADKVIGHIVNIGAGHSITIKETANQIASNMTKDDLIKIGAIPYRSTEIMDYSVVIDKAKSMLGWYPKVSLSDGLLKTIESFNSDSQ